MDFSPTGGMNDNSDYMIGNFETPQDRAKRRRSIKRRKFDDELVEYSRGLPGASMTKLDRRIRTQSYTGSPYAETVSVGSVPSTPPVVHTPTPDNVKRKLSSITSKKSKKRGHLSQLSTKDLGRWKPSDDLALIVGVLQTNDLKTVYRGIKFSCRFTLSELQSRWYALLYNAEVSRVAVAAMRNLHPDLVATVKSKALFSKAEEELLSSFPSSITKNCTIPLMDKFQELLDQNPNGFYESRTAKALMNHWQLMKHFQLLPDQTVEPIPKGDNVMTFSDAEDTINDSELQDGKDEEIETELFLADRNDKKEIRLLENSLSRWQVLVQSIVGGDAFEFDKNTLAVLRGRHVRYLMKSKEITVGRATGDYNVDIDLSLEGPAAKISRRQGVIRLRNNGDFFMSCEGKRPVFVDSKPILNGNKIKLNHNSVIEIASLHFVFLINQDFINAIRQEAVKVNIQP